MVDNVESDDSDRTDVDGGGADDETDMVRASIDPDPMTAEHDLLALIAESEGKAIEERPSFYEQVDHFVELLFKRPPSPESQRYQRGSLPALAVGGSA